MKDLVKVNETTAVVSVEKFGATIIEQFIAARNFPSVNSAKTYRNVLRQLFKFFSVNQVDAPTDTDINAFVASLTAAKKSASTIRLYTTVTKTFFAWLEHKGLYRNVAADVRLNLRKSTKHAKKALSAAQAQKLLAAVTGDDFIARRDKAIIALALSTGLRTIEIARADVGDLRSDDNGNAFLDVQGKGRLSKDETVRVPAPVVAIIAEYLSLRGNVSDTDPLFVSASNQNRGKRICEQSIGKLIKRHMLAAGINDKKITAHSTRSFAATQAIKNGVDIREIQAMLRHASLNVTAIYLKDLAVETRQAELSVAATLFGGAA